MEKQWDWVKGLWVINGYICKQKEREWERLELGFMEEQWSTWAFDVVFLTRFVLLYIMGIQTYHHSKFVFSLLFLPSIIIHLFQTIFYYTWNKTIYDAFENFKFLVKGWSTYVIYLYSFWIIDLVWWI